MREFAVLKSMMTFERTDVIKSKTCLLVVNLYYNTMTKINEMVQLWGQIMDDTK